MQAAVTLVSLVTTEARGGLALLSERERPLHLSMWDAASSVRSPRGWQSHSGTVLLLRGFTGNSRLWLQELTVLLLLFPSCDFWIS